MAFRPVRIEGAYELIVLFVSEDVAELLLDVGLLEEEVGMVVVGELGFDLMQCWRQWS